MTSRRPLTVRDAMRASFVSVEEGASPRRILAGMERARIDELPVVGEDGAFRAMVERRAVERHLFDRGEEDTTAALIAEDAVARALPDELIDHAVEKMLAANLAVVPVVSTQGRLEGVLVLEDLRRVPDLVETVGEGRRHRAEDAELNASKIVIGCSLVSAALGVILFALWVEGPAYGLPTWVSWVDAIAALLALVGAVAATSREMFSIPLWAICGVGLCFAAATGHAWKDGVWSTWVQLALAAVFFLMVVVLGATVPHRRRARARLADQRPAHVTG